MDNNPNEITVVFSNVPDMEALAKVVDEVVVYPVVKKKEQNNGIASYVIQGLTDEETIKKFKEKLKERGMEGVNIVTTVGNIFKF